LRYIAGLFLHPIVTIDLIAKERNRQASSQALWIILIAFLINTAMNAAQNQKLANMRHSIWLWLIVFVFPPLAVVGGRWLFVRLTALGVRILASKKYPVGSQERREAKETLTLLYPYMMMPNALAVIVIIVSLTFSSDVGSGISLVLLLLELVYGLVLQVAAIRHVYAVSNLVALFAPAILFILVGIALLITTLLVTWLVQLL